MARDAAAVKIPLPPQLIYTHSVSSGIWLARGAVIVPKSARPQRTAKHSRHDRQSCRAK
jgi:hypothetical protein